MAFDFEGLGDSFLLQVAGAQLHGLGDGPLAAPLQGGGLLEARTPKRLRHEGIGFRVRGLSFHAPGVRDGVSGLYFVVALSGTGTIRLLDDGDSAAISFTARTVVQFARDDHQNFEVLDADLLAPRPDVFSGRFEATLTRRQEGRKVWFDPVGTFRLVLLQGGGTDLRISFAAPSRIGPLAPAACTQEKRCNVRRVVLQPVGVSSRDGQFLTDQMVAVMAVWGQKCCFSFALNPFIEVGPAAAVDVRAIASSQPLSGRDPAIFVFITADPLASYGGGVTLQTSIVLSNQGKSSAETLLAHELGHVFRGLHPRSGLRYGYWVGDEKTVLKPGGSSARPSPTRNTLHNARAALNPFPPRANPVPCCFEPDPSVSTGASGSQGTCRCSGFLL